MSRLGGRTPTPGHTAKGAQAAAHQFNSGAPTKPTNRQLDQGKPTMITNTTFEPGNVIYTSVMPNGDVVVETEHHDEHEDRYLTTFTLNGVAVDRDAAGNALRKGDNSEPTTPLQAAKLSLALIKSAGLTPTDHNSSGCIEESPEALEEIAYWLEQHIAFVERKAQESAEHDKLEKVAYTLYRIGHGHENTLEMFRSKRSAHVCYMRMARAARDAFTTEVQA